MADGTTTTYTFTTPEVGASDDTWGTKLNANWEKVDNLLDGTDPVTGIDINSGTIDNTPIGATTAAGGTFTGLVASTATISGGSIDSTQVGGTTPSSVTGTTVTATNFVGPLAGTVTGDVTGNLTGDVTGDLTGDVTGNVTASSGSSAFNNVTINGSLDMDSSTSATITGLSEPTLSSDAATKSYVDAADALKLNLTGGTLSGDLAMGSNKVTGLATPTATSDAATKGYVDQEVSAVIASAPEALDTLNELAAALGDDANFSTTVTNSIATKLPLAGGTMTGDIAMGSNKVTGLSDPAANGDAATKSYVDTADNLKLNKAGDAMSGALDMGTNKITGLAAPTAGGDAATKSYTDTANNLKVSKSGDTMSGELAMGANKITGLADPTTDQDAATKGYIDTTFGSTAAAAVSAANAATSETNASNSADAASTAATNAAASYDSFDDRYLGSKASDPTLDNDGDALIIGALYFNATSGSMRVYGGSSWADAGSAVNGIDSSQEYTATAGQTTFSISYDVGFVQVYLNGIRLDESDYTATNGTSVVLDVGATAGDVVFLQAFGSFELADHYTKVASDARFLNLSGGTLTGGLNVSSGNVGIGTSSPATALEVSEGGGASTVARFTNSAQANSYIQFNDTASTVRPRIGSSGDNLILDTANTERMRIDSSGNVLVGKTTADSGATEGVEIQPNSIRLARTSNPSLFLNRLTSDGEILRFRKDGTTVGSWRSRSGLVSSLVLDPRSINNGLGIGTTDATAIVPTNNLGSLVDSSKDLGQSGLRWRDLYLSGGVYLGGTGSANKLDDYEEGTWTPSITSGGFTGLTGIQATYVKIGAIVHIRFYANLVGTGSTEAFFIGGLPFNSISNGYESAIVDFGKGGKKGAYGRIGSGDNALGFLYSSESIAADRVYLLGSDIGTGYILFSMTYQTNQ